MECSILIEKMFHHLVAIILLFIFSCSTPASNNDRKSEIAQAGYATEQDSAKFRIDKGVLDGKIEKLDISYAAIMCPCAQWFETKLADDTSIDIEYFYVEPASPKLINADTLFNGERFPVRVLVTGQFYSKVGYPRDFFPSKGDPKPAKVFRYNKIEIVQRGNAISLKDDL